MFRYLAIASAAVLISVATISAQENTPQQVDSTTQSEEARNWDAIKDSGTSADIFAFIERYPSGAITKEAKARMIDLLWTELAAKSPAPSVEAKVDKDTSVEVAALVTFSAPLTQGSPEIIGKTLEALIAGNPLFPPVEGLPEASWKTQKCASCHEWQQANLCTQANSYLSDSGAENLVKKHPYGGSFKLSLRNWATNGCN